MNFKTLSDYKKEEKGKEGKRPNDFYTGGEHSGLAVESPKDVKEVLSKAKMNPVMEKPDADPENQCRIEMYHNGFIVDGGPFRDYSAPENKQFMEVLNSGKVPPELRTKYKKGMSVNIVDYTDDQYVPPPPPAYVPFSGAGLSLAEPKQQKTGFSKKPPLKALKVDNSKPTTTVIIRLPEGKTEQLVVNLSTRTEDLTAYARGLSGAGVALVSGFPPKDIEQLGKTVEEADLVGSLLICKQL